MSQKGFSQIILLGIIAVLILAGAGGFLVSRDKKMPFSEKTVQQKVSSEDVISPIEPTLPSAQSIRPSKPTMQPESKQKSAPSVSPPSFSFGSLCSSEKECISFCQSNRRRCEIYCKNNHENKLCKVIFPPEESFIQKKSSVREAEFKFARFPFDIKDIGSITPVGEFSGITRQTAMNSHHYGNMRHYIFSKKPGEYAYNVYVPADGEITGFRNESTTGEFRFNFKISDKSFYYLDHIQTLTPEILEKLKPYFGSPLRITQAVEQVYPPIPIKAGFVLGQTGLKGIVWDWGVIDQNYCQDILYPEHYYQDRCPRSVYDFMNDEMKAQVALLAGYWFVSSSGHGFMPVKTTTVLGQYAHDIAGTLSGSWFKEYKSWQNAFFVPDPYEANTLQIRLAIPELSVFGVWNRIALGVDNVNPDPKKITPTSGIVSYILPLHKARDTNEYGVLLVRVNNDETITVETLSETTSATVNPQFTNKAMILKR